MSKKLEPTAADLEIQDCIRAEKSFALVAGAGSGKTTSLVMALNFARDEFGRKLRRDGQKVVCITYTNRAVEVISTRLRFDDLFLVSTIHGFLWGEIKGFQADIRETLRAIIVPQHIEKAKEKDTGKDTKSARAARAKVARLEAELEALDAVERFEYDDQAISRYDLGQLNHDDVIAVAASMIVEHPRLRKIMGFKYPYIFVDEAQDTFPNVVEAINLICADQGLPVVGYFGDPMQQIYDKRAGSFATEVELEVINKVENYRCSKAVITLLNKLRDDVQQVPAGPNQDVEGSVNLTLINAEAPESEKPKGRYTPEQLERAAAKFQEALESWGWQDNQEAKRLFLVRQMIARRLGFFELNKLFTGVYASSKAQDEYENGTHYLLKPFLDCICPFVSATRDGDNRRAIDVLRSASPAFDVLGENKDETLSEMMQRSRELSLQLFDMWDGATVREILGFCIEHRLCRISERLSGDLSRQPRAEEYDDDVHQEEKSDWLADVFLQMNTEGLEEYCDFIWENTPFSTQHGVKGEEYDDVIVVFDDVEAAWNQFSFTKALTPQTSGGPTEGQREKSRKLAYVCFSRAMKNLRILLFTPNAESARDELLDAGMFSADQIEILA
jgi:DNA helicase-2/ATP-dependent DNA helicase PcrA